jgi:hypothetical protein
MLALKGRDWSSIGPSCGRPIRGKVASSPNPTGRVTLVDVTSIQPV